MFWDLDVSTCISPSALSIIYGVLDLISMSEWCLRSEKFLEVWPGTAKQW